MATANARVKARQRPFKKQKEGEKMTDKEKLDEIMDKLHKLKAFCETRAEKAKTAAEQQGQELSEQFLMMRYLGEEKAYSDTIIVLINKVLAVGE